MPDLVSALMNIPLTKKNYFDADLELLKKIFLNYGIIKQSIDTLNLVKNIIKCFLTIFSTIENITIFLMY